MPRWLGVNLWQPTLRPYGDSSVATFLIIRRVDSVLLSSVGLDLKLVGLALKHPLKPPRSYHPDDGITVVPACPGFILRGLHEISLGPILLLK